MPRIFRIVSIVAHVVVVASALAAQLLAVGPLPIPRQPLTFAGFTPIQIVQPPPPRQSSSHSAERSEPSPDAAPIIAPEGVTPESGLERTEPAPATVGIVDGGWASSLMVERIPSPPPSPPQRPIRLHSGMQAPRKIVHVNPVYPSLARSAQVAGVVILEAVIDAQGRVESVRVLRSIPLLDQAATDAVKQWSFTPALLNGVPVPVVMTVTVNFEMASR
jgi:protein TonB